ncbi:alpha/beta hydrolase family protein [Rhizomonospora bruguierae]|uniref:alpha/beta hydrolase family protein n=1 Tax=Rhizomonospora bruguierae TaxID=1581705 RepID=UPI001BCE94CB|nr:alpha/beta family hydrolase [Micromonospora sp. NBRC 107566]
MAESIEIDTPRGPARVSLDQPARPARCLLLLGHGAGGDVTAPDLVAVRDAAVAAGAAVALVTQPYRVAGRRTPPPAPHLDEAWAVVAAAVAPRYPGVPMVFGGRSSGARVACRAAAPLGAAGVIALAFPLHPPDRPERSRAAELPTTVPTLVVNGDRDPFGVPGAAPPVEVVVRPGERHDLRRDPPAVAAAVLAWLTRQGWLP